MFFNKFLGSSIEGVLNLVEEVDGRAKTAENGPLHLIEFFPNNRNGLNFMRTSISKLVRQVNVALNSAEWASARGEGTVQRVPNRYFKVRIELAMDISEVFLMRMAASLQQVQSLIVERQLRRLSSFPFFRFLRINVPDRNLYHNQQVE